MIEKRRLDEEFDLNGAVILIADDDPLFRFIISKYLNLWNAEVHVAENGLETFEKVKEERYDLILMDINMPGLDGFETTRAIRRMDEDYFQHLPVIGMYIVRRKNFAQDVAFSGMTGWIDKKFSPVELFHKLSFCL